MDTYIVSYPVQCGWGIMDEEFKCKAFCKLHAFVKFIEETKDFSGHYSDKTKRTIPNYPMWRDDIRKVDDE